MFFYILAPETPQNISVYTNTNSTTVSWTPLADDQEVWNFQNIPGKYKLSYGFLKYALDGYNVKVISHIETHQLTIQNSALSDSFYWFKVVAYSKGYEGNYSEVTCFLFPAPG